VVPVTVAEPFGPLTVPVTAPVLVLLLLPPHPAMSPAATSASPASSHW
jgi:hypothetical protein